MMDDYRDKYKRSYEFVRVLFRPPGRCAMLSPLDRRAIIVRQSYEEGQMTEIPDKLLYSPEETAVMLGCGRSYTFELIARGELESFKLGRLRKVPREAIDAYIQRLRTADGGPTAA